MRILIAQINPTVGDFEGNGSKIINGIEHAQKIGANLALFPELAITGYPPEDFLLLSEFIQASNEQLNRIIKASNGLSVVLGLPIKNKAVEEKPLINAAAIIEDGKLLGFQGKSLLPTYDVFDERRYFEPASSTPLWIVAGKKVGITICEDLWQHPKLLTSTTYRRDPVMELKELSPDLVLNLSASPYSIAKIKVRLSVFCQAAKTLQCPVAFCNQVGGNDSLIFDGYSGLINSSGKLVACAKGFSEDFLVVEPFSNKTLPIPKSDPVESLFRALVLGVKDYFRKQSLNKACIGLSGGIDSAVVACIAAEALGYENILGVLMPSRYSSEGSIIDAQELAYNLKINTHTIPIEKPFSAYLDLLQPEFGNLPIDVTEENIQARVRGMILMALSNKLGYLVLSTSNKSELALGYSTLYGDMCGGLSVINDVTKEQVYALAHWINHQHYIIPESTITKPPSAELRPNQKDSDSLPSYEIIDNVLNAYVERLQSPEDIANQYHYPLNLVKDLVRRIHYNEYKRRQSAPGLRVTEKAFTTGRRFPIVQKWI